VDRMYCVWKGHLGASDIRVLNYRFSFTSCTYMASARYEDVLCVRATRLLLAVTCS